jgi:hypothetical protein
MATTFPYCKLPFEEHTKRNHLQQTTNTINKENNNMNTLNQKPFALKYHQPLILFGPFYSLPSYATLHRSN